MIINKIRYNNLEELALIFGFNRETIRVRAKKEGIRFIKKGHVNLYKTSSIRQMLKTRKVQGRSTSGIKRERVQLSRNFIRDHTIWLRKKVEEYKEKVKTGNKRDMEHLQEYIRRLNNMKTN